MKQNLENRGVLTGSHNCQIEFWGINGAKGQLNKKVEHILTGEFQENGPEYAP